MRVWERGTGETLGCGTGACAAAVASVVRGFCNREELIRVQLPGGELVVDYSAEYLLDGRGERLGRFLAVHCCGKPRGFVGRADGGFHRGGYICAGDFRKTDADGLLLSTL